MEKLQPNEYRCAHCRKVYQNGWSDEESKAEAEEIFGKHPDGWNDEQVVICDDCFQARNPRNYPEMVEMVKKHI